MGINELKMFRSKKDKLKAEKAELPKVDSSKITYIIQRLEELKGEKYSDLSYEDKKLVELACYRVYVTKEGKRWTARANTKFHTLTLSPWFKWFIGMSLGGVVNALKVDTEVVYIVEDEPMIVSNLDVSGKTPTKHPIADAINLWPNNEPVHNYKDVESTQLVGNAWLDSNKNYSYALRPGFLKSEPEYHTAPVWQGLHGVQEEPGEQTDLARFLNSLGKVEQEDLGKISFLLEVNEYISSLLCRTKPEWAEFLDQRVSTVGMDDAVFFYENIRVTPVVTRTMQEFLESCMKNEFTILEI